MPYRFVAFRLGMGRSCCTHATSMTRKPGCGTTVGALRKKNNFAQARWARGNAWITVGILDLLEIAPIDNGVRLYLLECSGQLNLATLPDC